MKTIYTVFKGHIELKNEYLLNYSRCAPIHMERVDDDLTTGLYTLIAWNNEKIEKEQMNEISANGGQSFTLQEFIEWRDKNITKE